jgi:hypothetical protein
MLVLAYFILASSVSLDNETNVRPTHIFFGSRTTDETDEEHLAHFSEIFNEALSSSSAAASASASSLIETSPRNGVVFGPLRKQLPFKWHDDEKYDTVNPFGDIRDIQYHAQWTFDIRDCTLNYIDARGHRQLPFARLQDRPLSLADMQLLGGPVPMFSVPTLGSITSYWEPKIEVDDRMRAFTHRLLRDFHRQWRHILRNQYNLATLRKLARAIVRLVTLDFQVRENTGGHGRRGVHVWITQLPAWEPFDTDILRVGHLWIVLCEDLLDGLKIARQHSGSSEFILTHDFESMRQGEPQAHYLIMSVKCVMLCNATGPSALRCTSPVELFNGDDSTKPASHLALEYLIWATASARLSVDVPIRKVPLEVQDMILSYVSQGTVAAARLGCLVGLGSLYLWKDGPLTVTLEERYLVRPSGSSVESEIWFDEVKSGIVYLARAN